MISTNSFIKYIVLFALFFLVKGCSVKYTFTGASIPLEAKTFTIYPVKNVAPTVNTGLAASLHQKLTEKMLSQTSLGPTSYDGDLTFEVTVTGYDVRPVAIQGGEVSVAAQNRLTIRLKVKYTNRYDKEANFEKPFSQEIDYNSSSSFDAVEDGLVDELSELLSTDVFNAALVNW